MPVTLAEAKQNAQTDLDVAVIDEFTKSSDILDRMTFDDAVSPTGGSTLLYGYRRLTAQRGAAFRAINTEYTPAEVTTTPQSVELKPLGGSFQVDRVISRVGPAASGAVTLNMQQLIKASKAKFADAVINGDTAVDANGFDGLSKILTGSTTEYLPLSNGVSTGYVDWTAVNDKATALAAQRHINNWLSLMDEDPDVIYGNRLTLSLFHAIAAWVGQISTTEDSFGRTITRYRGIPLVDLKSKAGSNTDVIALASKDTDGAGSGGTISGLGDLYAVRYGLDGFHGASMAGDAELTRTWLPDFTKAGAVKTGECELGPVAPVLRSTKAAAVFRNIKSA
ncbi:phage capsid protein [Micromonospora sp. LHW51205]|uniref:major capsid protein n=1 Tax=Micromonospora sp. LHW51205 TaxID=2248752 RepID=UPI000DEA8696|nr:phage capsid protein [Micromonospora sp. LHW51205]RBQ05158.1 phage capsid protein [Micromonospora sp. LHW51205]